jgi:phosphatidate cytidylyltransferase
MKTRLLSGIFLIGCALFALLFSPFSKNVLALVISLGILIESLTLSKQRPTLIIISSLFFLLLFNFSSSDIINIFFDNSFVLIAVLVFFSLIGTELIRKQPYFKDSPFLFTLRTFVLCFFLFFTLSKLFVSFQTSIVILVSIWATDSGAYIFGKLFGKRPLSPLSPKKTIEGAFAGLICGMSVFFIFSMQTTLFSTWVIGLIIGIIFILLSQIGDLHESMIKRVFNVKDSSKIIPGHGGIYDRCDSYVFAVPFFVITQLLV